MSLLLNSLRMRESKFFGAREQRTGGVGLVGRDDLLHLPMHYLNIEIHLHCCDHTNTLSDRV